MNTIPFKKLGHTWFSVVIRRPGRGGMLLLILTALAAAGSLPIRTAVAAQLKAGVAIKRHEFTLKGKQETFVFFEGAEKLPFWRRERVCAHKSWV